MAKVRDQGAERGCKAYHIAVDEGAAASSTPLLELESGRGRQRGAVRSGGPGFYASVRVASIVAEEMGLGLKPLCVSLPPWDWAGW